MHRSRSSIPYDILHGINISANMSTMFAYLSYFPPPPPVILGPPPQRSWTCSAHSFSSSSCLISDDLNPLSLRQYVPLTDKNQSFFSTNTSQISKITHENLNSSSIKNFFQHQLPFILSLIIFSSIFLFVILLFFLFLYIQRTRQRQLTSNSHLQTNNNLELNNNTNKTPKFYYRLIPFREKHRKHPSATPARNPTDGNNLLRLTNHDSPVLEVKRLSKSSTIHINNTNEQEESL